MAWSDEELRSAELVHGPHPAASDTYRLSVPATEAKDGKHLDIPGWMVGDPAGAALRMKAAAIIRDRLKAASGNRTNETGE